MMSEIQKIRDEVEKLEHVVKGNWNRVWTHLVAAASGAVIAVMLMEMFG